MLSNAWTSFVTIGFVAFHFSPDLIRASEVGEIQNMITVKSDENSGNENEIPVFPTTTLAYSSRIQNWPKAVQSKNMDEDQNLKLDMTYKGKRKNIRLMRFLRRFRLDFSKFDSSCLKRGKRGIPAPILTNGRILKYTRRRNRSYPRNRYGMVLYECDPHYAFPPASADRMFCSKKKWVGPRPVCLPKGSLEARTESGCRKCQQICYQNEDSPPLCSCYAGYKMTNGTCTDIDECQSNNGGCFGICFNTPGSFQCFCPSGFQVGPDGRNCIDKNECLLRNGHGPCQDRCSNTIGSYSCTCEGISGTKLAPDKHSCEDRNECEEDNNFGCSHTCINTFGNAFCSCPSGFVLSRKDYKTCLSKSLDETEEALMAENLVERPEEVVSVSDLTTILASRVECPPGSEQDSENPQICVEHEDCSERNGGCDHNCVPSGSFRFCSCRTGYELVNETSCLDQNECEEENGGCDQDCINTDGSFFCDCKEGYHLAEDNRICKVKFCDEPPRISPTLWWDCQFENGTRLLAAQKQPVGTVCALHCHPGLKLRHNYTSSSSPPSNFYHRFQYELVKDEPEIPQKLEELKVKCTPTGNWSPGAQALGSVTCIPSNCPRLSDPEHGSLFPDICLQEEGVPLQTQCLVLCAKGFYPKNGRIRTCSRHFRWFPEENPICVRLPPTPRPYIHCPSDLVVDLKAGQSSAHVIIPQPQANMDWYRYVEADPPWAKSLEWDIPAGVTQVIFTARSPVSNDSATCYFKIHIVDREAPRVQGCPSSFHIRLDSGETSREAWWSEPKFTDNVKLHYVQQSHSPGHLLTRGSHYITYVAGDAEGNKARCAFTITVHGEDDFDALDPSYYSSNIAGRHIIICPNLKTGSWNLHFAYYLPPGCRYYSQHRSEFLSKMLKQHSYRNIENPSSTRRVNRRATALRKLL